MNVELLKVKDGTQETQSRSNLDVPEHERKCGREAHEGFGPVMKTVGSRKVAGRVVNCMEPPEKLMLQAVFDIELEVEPLRDHEGANDGRGKSKVERNGVYAEGSTSGGNEHRN